MLKHSFVEFQVGTQKKVLPVLLIAINLFTYSLTACNTESKQLTTAEQDEQTFGKNYVERRVKISALKQSLTEAMSELSAKENLHPTTQQAVSKFFTKIREYSYSDTAPLNHHVTVHNLVIIGTALAEKILMEQLMSPEANYLVLNTYNTPSEFSDAQALSTASTTALDTQISLMIFHSQLEELKKEANEGR
jgi:hypothetical protein